MDTLFLILVLLANVLYAATIVGWLRLYIQKKIDRATIFPVIYLTSLSIGANIVYFTLQ